MSTLIPVIAGGDINPARFVSLSTSANNTVVESNAGDTTVVGITDESTKNAPQTGGSTLHAEDNDHVRMHQYGEDCLVKVGTGGLTAGDYVKPDADGKGVTASTTADVAFAIAFETATAGDLARVMPISAYYIQ